MLLESRLVDLGTLLRLSGHGKSVKASHTLRTVSFEEALGRVGQMLDPGGVPANAAGKEWIDRFKPVIAARNGAAHLGEAPSEADLVARLAVTGASQLLPHIAHDLSDLFGSYERLANALLDAQVTAVRLAVEQKLAAAKNEYQRRYGRLLGADLDRALGSINVPLSLLETDGHAEPCPACGNTGILTGPTYLDIEGQYDEPLSTLLVFLAPSRFICPVCLLRLVGEEELGDVGLDRPVRLREAMQEDIDYQVSKFDVDYAPGDDPPDEAD